MELIIYISVLAVVAVFAVATIGSLSFGGERSEARSEVSSAIRVVFNKVKADVKDATAVSTPARGANTANLVITTQEGTITYDLSGGRVRRQVNNGTNAELTPSTVSVTTINFEHIESINPTTNSQTPAIRVTVTAEATSSAPSAEYTETKVSTFSLTSLFGAYRGGPTGVPPPPGPSPTPGGGGDGGGGSNIQHQ